MENTPYATFDYSELPIIKIEFTGEDATDENFEHYLKEMVEIPSKTKYYILIMDTSKSSYLSVKHRILQGQYLEENKEHIAQKTIATLFITPSFLHRTILKALFVIKSYPSPVFIIGNQEEASQKIEELLKDEKINT